MFLFFKFTTLFENRKVKVLLTSTRRVGRGRKGGFAEEGRGRERGVRVGPGGVGRSGRVPQTCRGLAAADGTPPRPLPSAAAVWQTTTLRAAASRTHFVFGRDRNTKGPDAASCLAAKLWVSSSSGTLDQRRHVVYHPSRPRRQLHVPG
jgi:hypothetical protein